MNKLKISNGLVAILLVPLILAGCDSSELPDLKGRYMGEKKKEGASTEQVIAEVPAPRRDGKSYVFEFDLVTAVLPTVQERIWVKFSKDDKASLIFPSFSSAPIALQVKDSCAKGRLKNTTLSLCWTNSQIEFEASDDAGSEPRIEVSLSKSNELPPISELGPEHPYTIEEVMARAKFNAYSVSQEAERVFQAKKGITVALGNLLPHFNLRDLFPVVTGAGSLGLIEIVGDLLPFLFPSNWYKWKAAKAAYKAEKKSFASLRGNEMNQMEGLFYVLHRDTQVRGLITEHLKELKAIHEMVIKRERYGQMPQGSSERFSLSVLEVEQDLEQMDLLLAQEFTSLSHGVALPPAKGIQALANVTYPNPDTLKPMTIGQVFPQATQVSYELATLSQLIEAAKSLKGEFTFGFLDPLSSATLGFGYGASIQVGKSRIKELEVRHDETSSLIEKQSVDTVGQFNSALKAYQVAKKGLETSRKYLAILNQRLRLGDDSIGEDGFVEELRETSHQLLKFQASRLTSVHAILVAQSKVSRLLLQGYYTDLEVALPEEGTGNES